MDQNSIAVTQALASFPNARMLHIPINLNLASQSIVDYHDNIDLTLITQLHKITAIEGLVILTKPRNMFTGKFSDQLQTQFQPYKGVLSSGRYQQYFNSPGVNIGKELRRSFYINNPPQLELQISANNGSILDYVFMDIYLTNFPIAPYSEDIVYPTFG